MDFHEVVWAVVVGSAMTLVLLMYFVNAAELSKDGGKALDEWTVGHFALGVYLGFFMRTIWAGAVFLIYWELHELLFYKEVKESVANRFVDLVVGIIGLIVGSLLQSFAPIPLS